MSEAKEFSTGAAISISSGYMLAREGFGAVHELMEWLAGFPIWTHQIPRMSDELRALALAQHANLPLREALEPVDAERWEEVLSGWERRLGKTFTFTKGDGTLATQRNPIDEAVERFGAEKVIPIVTDRKRSP